MLHRSPDGYCWSADLCGLLRLAQMPDCLMDSSDQIRKLNRLQPMVGDVFADDLGSEILRASAGVHDDIPKKIRSAIYGEAEQAKRAKLT